MASVLLPPHPRALQERLWQRPTSYSDALQEALIERWRIQVPIYGLSWSALGYDEAGAARMLAEAGAEPVRSSDGVVRPLAEAAGLRWVRISAQRYNSVAQYEYLARALRDELERERGM